MSLNLLDATIAELQNGLSAGHFSCVQLTKAYMARIEEVNRRGPELRAVNVVSPVALEAAKASDEERKAGTTRSMLHGIPILIKDHFPVRAEDGMSATFGSTALAGTTVKEEATLVARLREAGAIILGLANLSEWGWARGYGLKDQGRTLYPMGWSAVGGQGLNPYHLKGCTLGSSSGSAAAAAVGLAAAATGSDLNGSIILPASAQNLAAIRATTGLVSRANAMGGWPNHDSLGPIARCITDVAHVLQAMSGVDEKDPFTKLQPQLVPDFAAALDANALKGARLGIVPQMLDMLLMTDPKYQKTLFAQAVDKLRELGAVIVDDIPLGPLANAYDMGDWFAIVKVDVKIGLADYLANLQTNPNNIHNIADINRWNDDHPELEKPPGCEDQSTFESAAQAGGRDNIYLGTLFAHKTIAINALREVIESNRLDALIFPAHFPMIHPFGRAGAPVVTVPMGFLPDDTEPFARADGPSGVIEPFPGRPAGLAFGGLPWSDARLLSLAYSWEQATKVRQQRLPVPSAIPRTQIE